MMRLCLTLTLLLSACVAQDGPSEPYAFVGSWDCGDQRLTFTNSTYDDGTATYRMLAVAPNGRNFTLTFANGYMIGLAAVTETGLTWVSGSTGEQRNCRRAS